MTSRNKPNDLAIERSPRESALTSRVLAEISHAGGNLADLSCPRPDRPPPDMVDALTSTPGHHQVIAARIPGLIVAVTISPRGTSDPARDTRLWQWLCVYAVKRVADHPEITGGNVRPFVREELPVEFAAIAIEDRDHAGRLIAANTRQSHDSAKAALRKLGTALSHSAARLAGILARSS